MHNDVRLFSLDQVRRLGGTIPQSHPELLWWEKHGSTWEQTLTRALPPARPSENAVLESRPSCHHPISKEGDAGGSPVSPGSDAASEAGGSDGLIDRNQRTCSKSDEMLWFEGFIL